MGADYREWSLDRWVLMFDGIYGRQNAGLTDEQLWLHVVEEAGELAEDLRKGYLTPQPNKRGQLTGVLVNVADTFAWLSAFAPRYDALEKMVWEKFPNACSYCFMPSDCGCLGQKPEMNDNQRETGLQLLRSGWEERPPTLYGWQQMLDVIYGQANRQQTIEQIGFHLMEEVGEVAKAIRLGDTTKLKEELADVFAWSSAIVTRSQDLTGERYRLDDILWARYPDACPHCTTNPCSEELYTAKRMKTG